MEGLIAITSALSGVGKSTVASHLAISLWEAGKRVLLLDADTQAPSLDILFGKEEETVYTFSDVVEGMEPEKAVLTVRDGLFLLPSSVGADSTQDASFALSRLKKDLAVDFILLLMPCALIPSFAPLAESLLLISTPEERSLRANAALTLLFPEHCQRQYLVLCKTASVKEALAEEEPLLDMIDRIGLPLLAVFPFEYEKRRLCPVPILPNKKRASSTALASRHLAARLLGKQIPLLSGIALEGFSRRYYIERAKSKKDTV